MKKYILLMLLISCQEDCIQKKHIMTISDSIPVQFWANGELTYNETDICGVEVPCFCQPFECDDVITIQLQGDDGFDYSLEVVDESDSRLALVVFDELSSDVWQGDFTPSNYSICNEKVQMKIITEGLVDMSSGRWANYGSGATWDIGGYTGIRSTTTDGTTSSKEAVRPFYWQAGVTYTFSFKFDLLVSGAGYSSTDVGISEDSATTGTANHFDVDNYTTSGSKVGTWTITPTSTYFGYVRIFQTVNVLGSPASSRVTVTELTVDVSGDYTQAQSDCIDIKETHDCSELVNYTNESDFSNITYNTSPQPEFNIRIPAQFWKQNNPMEQEDSELSNGVIKTRRQTISEKQLLEVGYMPNYMHKKLQKVLMHDTITIDGDQWKRRDAYESENVRRYALKRANVWLTKYNSISDNTL